MNACELMAWGWCRHHAARLLISLLLCLFLFSARAAEPSAATNEEWVAPARSARKENPVAADAASIEKGKALYLQACMACHGAAGKGDGPAAASLQFNGKPVHPRNLADPKMREQSDGALFWKISEG